MADRIHGEQDGASTVRWERPLPIEQILGERTRWVLTDPEQMTSFIVHGSRHQTVRRLDDTRILAAGPRLNPEQMRFVQQCVFDPHAYYHGAPRFRRWPHVPNFALRVHREMTMLDLLIDLHNPGWDFACHDEYYRSWSVVSFTALAKALFPEFASTHPTAVWKKGVIRALIREQA